MSDFNAFKHSIRAELEDLVGGYDNVGLVASGALVSVTLLLPEGARQVATVSVSEPIDYRHSITVVRAGESFPDYYRKVYPHDRISAAREAAREVRYILGSTDGVAPNSPF